MSASNRKTKIIIEELQGDTIDDIGGSIPGAWVEIKREWSEVKLPRGQREFEDDRFKDKITYLIKMSYNQNIVNSFSGSEPFNSSYRIRLIEGDIISIHSIRPNSLRRKEMIITGVSSYIGVE